MSQEEPSRESTSDDEDAMQTAPQISKVLGDGRLCLEVCNSSLNYYPQYIRQVKSKLPLDFFVSDADPDLVFEASEPALTAEHNFQSFVNLAVYYRRKQFLLEYEWKHKVSLMISQQCLVKSHDFSFRKIQKIAQSLPTYQAVQQIKQISKLLYANGVELKRLENEEKKALYNQKIRKLKTNYILQITERMCQNIAVQMKALENTQVPRFIDQTEGELRQYQVHGFKFLLACQNLNYNAILADDLGLGKSLETIALLAALAENGIFGPHLLIVPSTLLYNWKNEFLKWFPACNVLLYYGNRQEREKQRSGWSYDKQFSVLLTSYNTAVTDQEVLKRRHFYFMIMDEAHLIRNQNSRAWNVLLGFSCEHKLLISGTPISNSASDIWSLLHFVLPKFFSSKAEFLELFARDVERMADGELGVSQKLVKSIHQLLRPFMLRRLKSEVESELPKKTEYIVPCPLTRKQLYLYNEFMAADTAQSGNYLQVVNVLTQLRKICNHPRLLEDQEAKSGFCMGPGVFQWNYIDVLVKEEVGKNDTFVIYNKQRGWWNCHGRYSPAGAATPVLLACGSCGKAIEKAKLKKNVKNELEAIYKKCVENPRVAKQLLIQECDYQYVSEQRYIANLLFAQQTYETEHHDQLCEKCQQVCNQDELKEGITLLCPGPEKIREEYMEINRFQTMRNVYSVRELSADFFLVRGAAFSVHGVSPRSYIYDPKTLQDFTFESYLKQVDPAIGYTWAEACHPIEKQQVSEELLRVQYRNAVLAMLQRPLFDAGVVRMLFDPRVAFGVSLFTYNMYRAFIDCESMQPVCFTMTRLVDAWRQADIMYCKGRVLIGAERAFLSPEECNVHEMSIAGRLISTNPFIDYFGRTGAIESRFLTEQLRIPYPNRYFYEEDNIIYEEFKYNLKLMRINELPHQQFYVPEKNGNLIRTIQLLEPTAFFIDYQRKSEYDNNIEFTSFDREVYLREITLPHEGEILDVEGMGGKVRIQQEDGQFDIKMASLPEKEKRFQLLRNQKFEPEPVTLGLNITHLSPPAVGYWSQVNAFINPELMYRQPYCVLPVASGIQCCCVPDMETETYNSVSFNQHTFSFRRLAPTQLFTKEQIYQQIETLHPFDLEEASVNLVSRPGLLKEVDRFETINQDLYNNQLSRYVQTANHADLIQESGKLIVLRQLLKKLYDRHSKCLIFTQETKMLDVLETFLTSLNYQYFRMDGSTNPKNRQMLVDKFNAFTKVFCFIMTTRTGGIGLNLTGADTVIFVDCDWNPQVHQQATDRVHRINETKPVEVYTLLSEYTVEENIVRRATQKKHLDKLIMRDGGFEPEFFEEGEKYMRKLEQRFSQKEKQLQMVYVSLIDKESANQRLSDVLDAFQDEDDQLAKKQLLEEQKGDIEEQHDENDAQIVETGQQLMKQVEIFTALQSAPPAFLRFFEAGYNSVNDIVIQKQEKIEIFGFGEELAQETVSERKKMMYQTYQVDYQEYLNICRDLQHYSQTQLPHDVARMDINRPRSKVKKIEVVIKARTVHLQ